MDNNTLSRGDKTGRRAGSASTAGDFGKKRRILVVDDDIHIIQMLRSDLETEGYDVLWATDALTGQALAWERQPDLIVSDVMMPGVDGLAMVESIFQRPGIKRMPVIFISAQVTENFHPEQKSLPAPFALMKKPLYLPEFNLLVRKFLAWIPS